MKRKATVRIVLWSLLLLFLLSVFLNLLSLQSRRSVEYETEATMVPATTAPYYGRAFATGDVNIRAVPHLQGDVVGMLQTGERVEISHEEIVNEIRWSYITSPVAGWVVSEYLGNTRTEESTEAPTEMPTEPQAAADAADGSLSLDPDQVLELEIEWVSGSITILPGDTDRILVRETGADKAEDAFVWKLKEGELSIEFCADEDRFISFGMSTSLSKDLTIQVPADWRCKSLEIDAASATVDVSGLTIHKVEFDGASGACSFQDCTVQRMDLDTASGDIRFTGWLGSMDCDAASANIIAVVENIPSQLDLDTMSGDLDITLPSDAGFTLQMDAMTKDFSTEFDGVTQHDGQYIRGDGTCRIKIDAMSGAVVIRKGASPAVS